MARTDEILTYHVPKLPDPSDPRFRQLAAGDVRSAIATGCEHLSRTLVHMPPDSCWAELRLVFDPAGDGQDSQSRLNLYLLAWASNATMVQNLDGFIRGGPLGHFFQFLRIKTLPEAQLGCPSRCYIVRRENSIAPLHTSDLNYKIPERYYTISPLVPNEGNDYLAIDRILDHVTEPVTISINVQPADTSRQLRAHTQYLARLADINHGPDVYDQDFGDMDYTGSQGHEYLALRDQFRPLAYKDPLANDVLRGQREIQKRLLEPLLRFRIMVMAQTTATAHLVCSVLAVSAFAKGGYRIVASQSGDNPIDAADRTCENAEIPDFDLIAHAKQDEKSEDDKGLRSLVRLATVEELSGVFRLPVASARPLCCRKNTDPPRVDPGKLIMVGYDDQSLTDYRPAIPRGIDINVLRKHLVSLGMPGYGKTTGNMNLLSQLARRQIPFLILECAKKEYRVLKRFKRHKTTRFRMLAKRLEVYTPGADDLSPFRFNPFEIVPGVRVIEHIERLISCFKASIPVSAGSLPSLLGEALEQLYDDSPDPEHPPVMAELIATIEKVLARKGYSDQTRSDMQTAIEVRLGVLTQRTIGRVFQCRHGIDIAHLMKVPSLIELDGLPGEQACLLVLFILVYIRAYLRTVPAPTSGLAYAILIEETHVIFGAQNNAPASEEIADTKSAVGDFIAKMLVELRALGVAVILSDQHPSALDPAACKSVASMIAFRQTHRVDRLELGQSMNLKEYQEQDLARLKPGEAFMLTEGYFEPLRIRTPNLNDDLQLLPAPGDEELLQSIRMDPWFIKARTRRLGDELAQLKECMDAYDAVRDTISSRIRELLRIYSALLGQKVTDLRNRRSASLSRELRALRGTLTSSHSRFERGPYRQFGYLIEGSLDCPEDDLRALAESLNRRYQAVVQLGTRDLLRIIDRLIQNLAILEPKETNHGKTQ